MTQRNGHFKSQIAASGLKNYDHWNLEKKGAFSVNDSCNDGLSLPKHAHYSKPKRKHEQDMDQSATEGCKWLHCASFLLRIKWQKPPLQMIIYGDSISCQLNPNYHSKGTGLTLTLTDMATHAPLSTQQSVLRVRVKRGDSVGLL